MTITFCALSVVGALCFAFAGHIGRFFVPEDHAVVHEAAVFIRTVAWSFGFIGVQFAIMGVLRASGTMVAAMIISLVSQWVLQFPLAYILSKHTSLQTHGLWWAFPIANVVTAAISAIWFSRGDWKRRRLIETDRRDAEEQDVSEQIML
jgi:Na+-driven multidrug efflux pump